MKDLGSRPTSFLDLLHNLGNSLHWAKLLFSRVKGGLIPECVDSIPTVMFKWESENHLSQTNILGRTRLYSENYESIYSLVSPFINVWFAPKINKAEFKKRNHFFKSQNELHFIWLNHTININSDYSKGLGIVKNFKQLSQGMNIKIKAILKTQTQQSLYIYI